MKVTTDAQTPAVPAQLSNNPQQTSSCTSGPAVKELSWAAYSLDGRELPAYCWSEEYFSSFPPGSVVADIGCGSAWALEALRQRGCRGIGTEVDPESLRQARAFRRPVVKAPAEALPIRTRSLDGIIFGGVLPFTEEDEAFAELARVLRPGGRLEAMYLGAGFALRDFLLGSNWRNRAYGLRALINTMLMALIGRKLPGQLGDTAYVSHRRLAALYARRGFNLRRCIPSPTFLGLPVFIYHSAERTSDAIDTRL